MPFTFLSHQAPVLPLKMAAPQWFDGTALCIGSMAPDLDFIVRGTGLYFEAHALLTQLWFCLPLTLVLTWVVKRVVAAPLGPHLPDLGLFHLRDYGRLGGWRTPRDVRGIAIVVVSALIGAYSHVFLDSFAHSDGWMVEHVAALQPFAFDVQLPYFGTKAVYVYDLLQLGLSAVGGAITVALLGVIGRRRMIRDWYPDPDPLQPTAASRKRLWGCTALATAVGVAIALATFHVGGPQHLVIRVTDIGLVGLVVGCVLARRTMRVSPDGSEGAHRAATAS
jgi:hypothetical protein